MTVKTPTTETTDKVVASNAGAALVARSREGATKQQELTGMVDGKRRRKLSLVRLPDGTIAELLAAARGKAIVRWTDPSQIDPERVVCIPSEGLKFIPLPAAQVLGRLKRGVKERSSPRKAAACRRNGMRPCRPGKRRGRQPRRSFSTE